MKVNYTEIFKLKEMLEEAGIPFEFNEDYLGEMALFNNIVQHSYQIKINENIDAIQCVGSYGGYQDLIEIMGALTEEEMKNDDVLGFLTAEEVFKRFKYCYENNTNIYVEVEK